MAIKPYKLCLSDLLQGGSTCSNPTITWEQPSCNGIQCELDGNCIKLQVDDDCEDKCFYVLIDCDDCGDCPAQKIKVCICETVDDCDDCETCSDDNVCVSQCDEGEFCDNNSCVECLTAADCECNQICVNGDCQCPPGQPYLNDRGCCSDCQTNSDCPDCEVCTGDGCVPVVCPSGVCNPETGGCVECLNSSDCSGDNECCNGDNECECCDGYVWDPGTQACVEEPECVTDSDCAECEYCNSDGECTDVTCPDGQECVGDECLDPCTCGQHEDCAQYELCIDRDGDTNCHCYDCEPTACSDNEECEEGCVCINGVCTKNDCYGTCTDGSDCGPGCGCYEGNCVPCESLPCAPDCAFADGCQCIDDTCTDGPSNCNESNADLEWVKVSGTPGTVTDPGKPALTGSVAIAPVGLVEGVGGNNPVGFYYDHQFTIIVNNGTTGTFYYSPQAGTNIAINTGASTIFNLSSYPINGNVFGFRIRYVDNDGREIIWEMTFDQTNIQAPNTWSSRLVSSSNTPPTTTGGTADYWTLQSVNSNFKFSSANPAAVRVYSSAGNPINITFTKQTDYILVATITGCGAWEGDFNMDCDGKVVTLTTDQFIIDETLCCEATDPNCGGTTGDPCGTTTVTTIDLIKFPYFDPTTNSFVVMVDMSSITFEELYFMSNICWGKKANPGGDNDVVFGGVFGTASSNLFVNITFTQGGCVTFGQDCTTSIGLCETGTGEICFDECDDFETFVYETFRDDDTITVKGYPAVDVDNGSTYTWTGIAALYYTIIDRVNDIETVDIDITGLVGNTGQLRQTFTLQIVDGDCDGTGTITFDIDEPPCLPNPLTGETASYDCGSGFVKGDNSLYYNLSNGTLLNNGTILSPGTYDIAISNDDGCSVAYELTVPQCWKCNSAGTCVEATSSNNFGYNSEAECNTNCDACQFRAITIAWTNSDTYCADGTLDFSASSNGGGAPNTFSYEIQFGMSSLAPNEAQPLNQGTEATFNVADLIGGGVYPSYTLIVTDQDGCTKEYDFAIDCFVTPECQGEASCYEMTSPLAIGSGGNAGRITSLRILNSGGSAVELLGTNIDALTQFADYYDVADYATLQNHLRLYETQCNSPSSLVFSASIDAGNNILVEISDTYLSFSLIVIENSAGVQTTSGFTGCDVSQFCNSVLVALASDLVQLDFDGAGNVINESLVCNSLLTYGDIAFSESEVLYGVRNGDVYSINTSTCSGTVLGSMQDSSPSAVFLDANNILYCFRDAGSSELKFYLYNIVTNTNSVWAIIPETTSERYRPQGDLAIIGNTVYGTFRNVAIGASGNDHLVAFTFNGAKQYTGYSLVGLMPGVGFYGLAVVNGVLYGFQNTAVFRINLANPPSSIITYSITQSGNTVDGAASIEDSGNPC